MPHRRRRIAVAAASTALLVGPLAVLVPSASATASATASASASEVTTVRAAAAADVSQSASRATRTRKCSGGRPESMIAYYTFIHRFPLPARAKWKKRYEKDRWCLFSNPRVTLRIGWAKRVGSMKAMKRRVRHARRTHDGFRLQRLHHLGAPFDSHTNRTAIAEFTFRGANGKRRHVRAVGDKYSVLIIRSSQKAWKNGTRKTANRAHRGMNRTILVAM